MIRTSAFSLVLLLAACAPDVADDVVPPVADDGVDVAEGDVVTMPATLVGPDAPTMTVFKSPTCGCCSMWIEHVEAAGFTVDARDRDDMAAVKDSLGLPSDLSSCHTGVVDGYVIEGHVPAQYVAQVLEERPDVLGLSVPGMPIGSPGMEVGDRPRPLRRARRRRQRRGGRLREHPRHHADAVASASASVGARRVADGLGWHLS